MSANNDFLDCACAIVGSVVLVCILNRNGICLILMMRVRDDAIAIVVANAIIVVVVVVVVVVVLL